MAHKILYLLPCIALCSVGLVVQVTYLSTEYFAYKTQTRISIDFPEFIEAPHYSYCARVTEVMDVQQTYERHDINLTASIARQQVFSQLKIGEIFNLSIAAPELISFCFFRSPGRMEISYMLQHPCSQAMGISRYFTQEFMCYKMGLDGSYDFERVAQSAIVKGGAYEFNLNRTLLTNAKNLLNIVHSADEYSVVYNRYFAQLLALETDEHGNAVQNFFSFSYSVFNYHLLPFPYVTNCGLNNGKEGWACRRDCLTSHCIRKLRKLPVNFLIDEKSNYLDFRLLDDYVLSSNITLQNAYTQIYDMCSKLCKKPQCHYQRFNTDLQHEGTLPGVNVIRVRVALPQYPSISVRHVPVYEINDYVLLIMSCMGTWFGVSMMDFNPLKLFRRESESELVLLLRRKLIAVNRRLIVTERYVQQIAQGKRRNRSQFRTYNGFPYK